MTQPDQTQGKPEPLRGIRVVDLTTVLAGPYCSYQLALLGAEVIKIERPGGGDWARLGTKVTAVPEFSAQFVAQNAGKKSVCIDLKNLQGRDLALRLMASADIVVENFSPGVAERLGVGYAAVRAVRKDIVYCALSGYGQDGAMSRRPAYDHVVQAASGITMLNGTAESVPNRIGPPMFDYLAGIYGAFAVLSALRERDRTGQSQMIDVAMLDAAIVAMASTVSTWSNAGIEPRPNGNTAASGSPASGIFATRDGLLSIAANQDQQVIRLCTVAGIGEVLQDARFASVEARAAHAGAFQQLLVEVFATRDASEWEQLLSDAHVPATRVRSVPQILSEPHMQQRQVQQTVLDPQTGASIAVPSIGFKWNQQALGPQLPPPRLGEHTEAVLTGLGVDTQTVSQLRASGVIG